MARLIAATGIVSYNGITFPSALHTKIQAKPMYQHGEVSRKYIHYTLTVDTVLTYTDPPLSAAVTANQNMGTNSIQYRKLLTEPRKCLTFGEQGFGEFVINAFAGGVVPAGYRSVKDVAFGPKPRLLVWEPIGSNRAAHVSWVCEFCIPECLSNSARDSDAMLEVTYECSFNVNNEGLLTRTVRATIEIAANALTNKFLDTVDNYVERFQPPKIDGFHRETNRQISRDHRVLNITYQDTEISSDNPFHEGLVAMDASHTVNSSFADDGFVRWYQTITGTFRWAKGVPAGIAWAAFADLVRQRYVLNSQVPVFNAKGAKKIVSRFTIPASISITEQIYNREASFTVSYISGLNIDNLFSATGLFTPVRNVSWKKWHNSLTNIQSPFGGSGLREKTADITVVDVCSGQYAATPNNDLAQLKSRSLEPWFDYGCSKVSPKDSWLDSGTPEVKIITIGDPAAQIAAAGPSEDTLVTEGALSTAASLGLDIGSRLSVPTPSTSEHTYQVRNYNEYMLEVTGTFIRICYEPYAPKFKSYGGVDLIWRDGTDSIKQIPGQFFPIFVLKYHHTYYLPRLPKGNLLTLLEHDAGKGDL